MQTVVKVYHNHVAFKLTKVLRYFHARFVPTQNNHLWRIKSQALREGSERMMSGATEGRGMYMILEVA